MMEAYAERMNQQRKQEALLAAQREQELREQEHEAQREQELLAQKQASQEKKEPPQNSDFQSLQNFTIIHKMSSISNTPQISLVVPITLDLPTEEPEYSLSMRNTHLSTILKTESDEVIKSSVKNLVPIPSGSEVTSDNESIEEADFDLKEEIRLVENLSYDNSSPRPRKNLMQKLLI
nr:hypothetical protein [Tanacetum cinerariifolium]